MNRQILVFLLALLFLLLAPWLGGEALSWGELFDPLSPSHRILFELRLPRLLVTIAAGSSLAVLGGTYQIIFHNALAEPYILGISSGVTLGILVGELLFKSHAVFMGMVFGILATFFILFFIYRAAGKTMDRIILFGTGLNFVLSSSVLLLATLQEQQVAGSSLRWLFGQIPWVSLQEGIFFNLGMLPFILILWVLGRSLDALSLGHAVARTLGVLPNKIVGGILALTSFWLAILVSVTGVIGFVGLVIPHLVRLFLQPKNTRELFLHSAFYGSVFLTLADVLSRVLYPPTEFPVGVITALLGGPLFLWALCKR